MNTPDKVNVPRSSPGGTPYGLPLDRASPMLRRKMGRYMEARVAGRPISDALSKASWTWSGLRNARMRYPEFARSERDLARAHDVNTATGEMLRPEPPEDFIEFRRLAFDHATPPHMAAIVEHLVDPECRRLLILVPPEHGKTTLLNQFQAYLIAHEAVTASMAGRLERPLRMAVISETSSMAETIGWQLRQMLEDSSDYPFLASFGPYKDVGTAWSSKAIWMHWRDATEKDPTVQWLGWRNQIQGARLTHAFLDDVDSPTSSATVRAEILRKLDHTIARRLGSEGKLIVAATRVDHEDLNAEFLRRAAEGHWHSVVLPAQDATGAPTWPERYTAEYFATVRAEINNDALYDLVYQQVSAPAGAATFSPEVLDRCRTPRIGLGERFDRGLVVAAIDPALDGAWATTVACYDRFGDRMRLLDQQGGKGGGADAMKATARWALQTYRPHVLAVERQGGMALFIDRAFRDEIAEANCRLELLTTTGQGIYDSYWGISALAAWCATGRVEIPWNPDAQQTFQPLVEEMAAFRFTESDQGRISVYRGRKDRLMATWFCFRVILDQGRLPEIRPFGAANRRAPWLAASQRLIPLQELEDATS